ncbi:hypothetical protein ACRRTK_023282 [Alexandromys fortis]
MSNIFPRPMCQSLGPKGQGRNDFVLSYTPATVHCLTIGRKQQCQWAHRKSHLLKCMSDRKVVPNE